MTDDRERKRAKREAKRRRREERRQREARVRYSKAEPLELAGTIEEVTHSDTSLAALRGPLSSLLQLIPTTPTSTGSRKRANELRIAAALVGAAIALVAALPIVRMLGCLLLILAGTLPMSPGTRLKWVQRAETVGRSRATTTRAAVAIVYDGRGVSVLRDSKTVRRVRDADRDERFRLQSHEGGMALGLVPRKGGRTAQLWFLAGDAPGDLDAETPVTVDETTLYALHDALRDDDEPPLGDDGEPPLG